MSASWQTLTWNFQLALLQFSMERIFRYGEKTKGGFTQYPFFIRFFYVGKTHPLFFTYVYANSIRTYVFVSSRRKHIRKFTYAPSRAQFDFWPLPCVSVSQSILTSISFSGFVRVIVVLSRILISS